jgi:hypothetical protein
MPLPWRTLARCTTLKRWLAAGCNGAASLAGPPVSHESLVLVSGLSLLACRHVGGIASAKLKRGARAAASAAVLNAIASIAGDLEGRSGVERGGENMKDGTAGGDRELVRTSDMRVNVVFSVSSAPTLATDAGSAACVGPAPFVACQLACFAAVAFVRWRRSRRLDAAGVVLGLVPVPAKPNANFEGPVLVDVVGVAGVAGDMASLAPAATARATGPAPPSQPALRLKPPSNCATLLLPVATGPETLRFRFPLANEGLLAPAATAAASRRLTSAGTNPAAAPEDASSLSELPSLSSEWPANPCNADILGVVHAAATNTVWQQQSALRGPSVRWRARRAAARARAGMRIDRARARGVCIYQ